ncbi:unnamed protein product [Caenorhabditis auriculariae]|uniref:Uncharacterized protein n=1 Tax=Caenorhabditis auriculariae TaxID=2777116 RepID=A0A8S1GPI1_9PELO|nr:unnamed protein product [Caenorhabditis auriculariae]
MDYGDDSDFVRSYDYTKKQEKLEQKCPLLAAYRYEEKVREMNEKLLQNFKRRTASLPPRIKPADPAPKKKIEPKAPPRSFERRNSMSRRKASIESSKIRSRPVAKQISCLTLSGNLITI